MKDLNALFQDTIKDIYDSEQRFVKAMPEMHQAAQSAKLRQALQEHLEQSREQIRRVEQVAQILGFDPSGVTCHGTVGLVKESQEHIKEFGGSQAGDAAIIACAQKNEHYEIANYGTAIEWAKEMNLDNQVVQLLVQSFNEEKQTDELLTQIAESEANQRAEGQQGQRTMAGSR